MHSLARPGAGLLILWLMVSAEAARADEALLRDGGRASGELSFTEKGRLTFTSKGKPLLWSSIQHIEFSQSSAGPDPLTGVRRVGLVGDQSLTGGFLAWGKDGLRLHPPRSEVLLIPLQWIECVQHPPGVVPVFEDDFQNSLDAWKVSGKPTAKSPKQGLSLSASEQAVAYEPPSPLDSGKLGVDFAIGEKGDDGRWMIELEFGDGRAKRPVRVSILVKDQHSRVETNLDDPKDSSLPCKPGRHHALIEFGPRRGTITLDDSMLWSEGRRGFGGTLRAIRLACVEADAKGATETVVVFNCLSLARKIVEPRRPSVFSDQDEVWLPSGDQLFGRLVSVNGRSLELETRERRLKLAWTEVVGFYPHVDTPPPRALQGEWVRVWLRTGTPGLLDELEGVVTKLDDKCLVVRHPGLGEVAIDRSRLHRLRRLFFGERIELENGHHHLGDKHRVLTSVLPARAEGLDLARSFRLDAVPSVARLSVAAVQLKGPGDGIGKALERGELRTEVWINKERVDYLNRLVDRATARPQRLSIDIPTKFLRKGDNIVELRQTPEPDTGQYENCGLSRLTIETEP
jgi:hypothetical protein